MREDEEIFGKRPKEYFKVKEKKSLAFKISCLYMGFMAFIPLFLAILGFKRIYFPGAPTWFFIINLLLGLMMMIGAIGAYNFKKRGLYLFVSTLIVDILFHLSLGLQELDAIHGLYLFIGLALVPIVPRWKYFN